MRMPRAWIALASTSMLGLGLTFVGLALAASPAQKPAAPAAAPASPAQPTPAETAARGVIEGFVKAFNAHDAAAVAGLFTDAASVVGSDGVASEGREAITTTFADSFVELPNLAVEAQITSARAVTADVIKVEGHSRISAGTGESVNRSHFSGLIVRKGDRWLLDELRDSPEPPEDVPPHERLRELEWMVGEWVNETDVGKISSRIHWADNHSFLVRAYSIELPGQKPTTGTMFIGWCPENGHIKSWVFDSEGGHGEGLWTRVSEDTWIVKASGTLRDGRASSATQIHTVLGKDSVKTVSIDRIIGGQLSPDAPEVVMVRKPPMPGAAAAPTPAPAPSPTPGR